MASNGDQDAVKTYTIPTFVYNVVSNDGTERGFVSDAGLKTQVDEMNKAYATAVTPDGVSGTSSDRAGIRWLFDLQGIVRIKAGDLCDSAAEKAVKTANHKPGKTTLNLYITDLSSCGLLGYSSWPWELDPKSGKPDALTMDGVVIHYETLPNGTYKPYNMGRTTIHETGHWMGLYHVFQNGGCLVCACGWGSGRVWVCGCGYARARACVWGGVGAVRRGAGPFLSATSATPSPQARAQTTLPPTAPQTPTPQAAARAATRWTTRPTRAPPPRAAPSRATRARSRGRTRFGTSWTTRTTSA